MEADRAQSTVWGSVKIEGSMRPAIKDLVHKHRTIDYNKDFNREYFDRRAYRYPRAGHECIVIASVRKPLVPSVQVVCMMVKPVDSEREKWARVGICSIESDEDFWASVGPESEILVILGNLDFASMIRTYLFPFPTSDDANRLFVTSSSV
ncbi:hypothetical protein F5Y17DRAFT_205706 [Xylariaceae sp. FL0594]|nr:hypothetical protein F5Y17DRAFT_205706 [Xylariaceae sp. FL0594]